MIRVGVNPTLEQLRSAFVSLLSDYANEKGLNPVRPSAHPKRGISGKPAASVAKWPGKAGLPMPDVVWLEGAKAIWRLYVMPGQGEFRRLLPGLKSVENGIIGVDSSGNIGLIEPRQLLHFLEHNNVSVKAKAIRSLAKHIPSVSPFTPDSHFKGTVEKNHRFVRDHFSLRIRTGLIAQPAPGQFLQIMCDSMPHSQNPRYRTYTVSNERWPKLRGIELLEKRPFLRRPFSIASYGPPLKRDDSKEIRRLGCDWFRLIQWAESDLEIVFARQPGGAGTGALANYRVGDKIDVVGPLGRGFTVAPLPKVAVLVGGGIGAPPLLFLAEELVRNGIEVKVFLGALTRSRIPFQLRGKMKARIPRFERLGISPIICTDDGTAGRRGLVTEPVSEYLEQKCEAIAGAKVFACGPRPMLAALQGIASRCDVPCEALLEERMACGFGACISCVCAVKESGQKATFTRICTDGPAFDVKKVMWHA